MLYYNTPSPDFNIQNPLAKTIAESEEIIARLAEASQRLEAAMADEQLFAGRVKGAKQAYEDAEYEHLSEVVVAGAVKEGVLAGIAQSSKSHDIVCNGIRAELRRTKLEYAWQNLEHLRQSYEAAQSERQQAETLFSALRNAAKLKAAILQAAVV